MKYVYSKVEIYHYLIPIIQYFLLFYNEDLLYFFLEGITLQWLIFNNSCSMDNYTVSNLIENKNIISFNKPYLDFIYPIYYSLIAYATYKSYLGNEYMSYSKASILFILFLLSNFYIIKPYADKFYKTYFRYLLFYFIMLYIFKNLKKIVNKFHKNLFLILGNLLCIYFIYLLELNHLYYEVILIFIINLLIFNLYYK